jgi:hypothetical protein
MIRRREAHVVVDWGGSYDDEWELLRIAFTDRAMAEECAAKRSERVRLDDGLWDWGGSYVVTVPIIVEEDQ